MDMGGNVIINLARDLAALLQDCIGDAEEAWPAVDRKISQFQFLSGDTLDFLPLPDIANRRGATHMWRARGCQSA